MIETVISFYQESGRMSSKGVKKMNQEAKNVLCLFIVGFIAAAALLIMPETYDFIVKLIGG